MTTMIGVKNSMTEVQPYKQGANDIEGVASDALMRGDASLTCLPSWPQLHPLNVGDLALIQANIPSESGLPRWLSNVI